MHYVFGQMHLSLLLIITDYHDYYLYVTESFDLVVASPIPRCFAAILSFRVTVKRASNGIEANFHCPKSTRPLLSR